MKKLKELLKNAPYNEQLETNGYFGEELYKIKEDLMTVEPFISRDLYIMDNPIWPKKGFFFTLTQEMANKLSHTIHIFGIHITKYDTVIMNCSEDSFIDYEMEE